MKTKKTPRNSFDRLKELAHEIFGKENEIIAVPAVAVGYVEGLAWAFENREALAQEVVQAELTFRDEAQKVPSLAKFRKPKK